MKTKIKVLIVITLMLITNKVWAIHIPEDIEYQEYCYYSKQCNVTKRNKLIIRINEILIKQWKKTLY